MNYKSYPNKKTVPVRKTRKHSRNEVFQHNKAQHSTRTKEATKQDVQK